MEILGFLLGLVCLVVIAWGDESGLRSNAQTRRGQVPSEQAPGIHLSQKNGITSTLLPVSELGLVRFMLQSGKLDSFVLISTTVPASVTCSY